LAHTIGAAVKLETLEGIVIKSLPYQDNKRIFSLFTDKGLLSFIADIKDSRPETLLVCSPLSKGEYVFAESKGGWRKIQDSSLTFSYLHFKSSYALLDSASLCLKAIALSQLENKPAPLLYHLLKIYLEKIPEFTDPYIVSSSFFLKVLRFEGLISLEQICSYCSTRLSQGFVDLSPSCGCYTHPEGVLFDAIEWKELKVLALAKEIPLLKTLECSKELHEKIRKLFEGFFR
jgi:DNA repair protein RecO